MNLKAGMRVETVTTMGGYSGYYYGGDTYDVPIGSVGVIFGKPYKDEVYVYLTKQRKNFKFHSEELEHVSRVHSETRIEIDDLFLDMASNRLGLSSSYSAELVLHPTAHESFGYLEKNTLPIDIRRNSMNIHEELLYGAEGVLINKRVPFSDLNVGGLIVNQQGDRIISLCVLPGVPNHAEIAESLLKYAMVRAYLLGSDYLYFLTWGRHRCRKTMDSLGFQLEMYNGTYRNGEPRADFRKTEITKKEVLKFAKEIVEEIPYTGKIKTETPKESPKNPKRDEKKLDSDSRTSALHCDNVRKTSEFLEPGPEFKKTIEENIRNMTTEDKETIRKFWDEIKPKENDHLDYLYSISKDIYKKRGKIWG